MPRGQLRLGLCVWPIGLNNRPLVLYRQTEYQQTDLSLLYFVLFEAPPCIVVLL